jgi:hypothetical protein
LRAVLDFDLVPFAMSIFLVKMSFEIINVGM